MDALRLFVVVSGPPGSGKSTLAPGLASELGLALVAKDTIKDALMAALPVPDVAESRRLGGAAIRVMFALANDAPAGAVLDCSFHRSQAMGELEQLPGLIVEVFCHCSRDLALQRYRARAESRHPGHFDNKRAPEDLWNDEVSQPVAGDWPVINVDTTSPVDIAELVRRVRALT